MPSTCETALRQLLGAARVRTDDETIAQAGANLTEFAPRKLRGVLSATSREDVQGVIAIAVEHRTPIYPISTGRNWGLGSKLPVCDGAWLLDLSAMNRIIDISTERAVALIEPGVTQGQLSKYLEAEDAPLLVDVTGAPAETSVLGNALERGVGMRGQRVLRGLEVVTGSGLVVRTGHWHYGASTEHAYPPGLGPDLLGAFVQSSFGIATLGAIALLPRQPVSFVLTRVRKDHLAEVVDALAFLRRREIIHDRIEIDGDDDPRLHELERRREKEPTFWVWVPLVGESDLVAPAQARVIRALRSITNVDPHVFTPGFPSPAPVKARLRRLLGVPDEETSVSDHDRGAAPGFVCALPAVPFSGRAAVEVTEIARAAAESTGVTAYVTFNSVSADAFEGYLRVSFDRRDPDAISRAHAWCDLAHEMLAGRGYYPLRLDVDRMRRFVRPDDDFWEATSAIKRALDPSGIIAPGRYSTATVVRS